MNPVNQSATTKTCQGCPHWDPSRPGMVPDAETIQSCIRRILGEHPWMTGEEFLAQVEARRQAHNRERRLPKQIERRPAQVITYWLKPAVIFMPERKEAAA